MWASDVAKRRQAQTLYANQLIRQTAINNGISFNMPSDRNIMPSQTQILAYGQEVIPAAEKTAILAVPPPSYKTAPSAPLNVTGVAGTSQVVVSWTVPTSDGGATITSYTVTSSPDGFTATVSYPTTTATVTGLTGGTAYTFTVIATNSVGNSVASVASSAYTPISASTPPLNVTGVPGNGQVIVSWTAPVSNGGSTIISYKATSSPGGFNATVSYPTTSATVTGLALGIAYTFTVVATNGVGDSVASSASPSYTPFSKGSMNFTGTSYIRIPSNTDTADSDFNLTTSPFTVEWWQYVADNNAASSKVFGIGRSDSGQPVYFAILYEAPTPSNANNRKCRLAINNGSQNYLLVNNTFTTLPSSWQHVAIVGNGSSSISVFLNGALLGTVSIAYSYTNPTYSLTIGNGGERDAANQFQGKITNFRWVNGTAVYGPGTSNPAPFTPPTSNLTAITGTKLLILAQTSGTMTTDSGPLNKTISNTGVTWSSGTPF